MENSSHRNVSPKAAIIQQFSVKEFIRLCLNKWWIFALSALVTTSLAVLYLLRTQPKYTRTAEVLIKEDTGGMPNIGGSLGGLAVDLGLFSNASSVYNEVLAMQSPYVIEEVVRRLHLDMNYTKLAFQKESLYDENRPVTLELLDREEGDAVSMRMTLHMDGSFSMRKFKLKKDKYDDEVTGRVGQTVKTPVGRIKVTANAKVMADMEEDMELRILKEPIVKQRETLRKILSVDLESKDASIIVLEYTDPSQRRADDIINTIVKVYQEFWLRDKNQAVLASSNFINERIKMIEHDLGLVESDISEFKSRNMLPDVMESTRLQMENANEFDAAIAAYQTRITILGYIRDFLRDEGNRHQLLPTSLIQDDTALSEQVTSYNNLMQTRNNLVLNSSDNNPLVKDYDKQLENIRRAILNNIDNSTATVKIRLATMLRREQKATSQIASAPNKAKELLSVERQQKVKEALYIFLLQQREENELSSSFSDQNTRIITPPMGDYKQSAPRKGRIIVLGFLLGLLIPALYYYLRETQSGKMRNAKEAERLNIPVVGSLPLMANGKKHQAQLADRVQVRENMSDEVNDAFRRMRTNLEFMMADGQKKVVMMTSRDGGSGKTLAAMNLATAFAINKQRVLLIDSDVRKGDLSRYLQGVAPQKGLSTYLAGQTTAWRELIHRSTEAQGLDILPAGMVPPNPSELFANGRFATLIEEAKADYDFIIVDAVNAGSQADTAYISQQTDQTVFVVRCGLTSIETLADLAKTYRQQKYAGMSLLVNGFQRI